MEIIRYKYIFIVIALVIKNISCEISSTKNNSHNTSTCPVSKIIEDIFKVNNKTPHPQMSNSERAKLFLHSIAKITDSNEEISQEELVNDIIAAINRIKNNITKETNHEMRLNEAIILAPKPDNTEVNAKTVSQIKSGIEDKIDTPKTNTSDEQTNNSHDVTEIYKIKNASHTTSTERTKYVEVLTIEPNNTHNTNVSSHNIIEVLKHLMPMFNSTLNKKLQNITIIEKNFIKNHSYSAIKNVSTIVVSYCNNENTTMTNITLDSGNESSASTTKPEKGTGDDEEYDYYGDIGPADSEDEEAPVMTVGEKKDILEASEYGIQKMHELYSVLEPKLYSMGLWLDDTNPARYVAAFNAPSEDAARFSRYGYASLQAATKLKELTSGGAEELEGRAEEAQLPAASALRQSPLMQHCPLKGAPKCPPASKRYRTHDGTCNNLGRPRWGSTMTPVQRFLTPSYSDGLQAPRRSVNGNQLPSAREISALVHASQDVESPGVTHLLMQWGQFLDHDITSTSQSRGFNGSMPRCCKNGGRDFVPKEFMHPECFPIAVPASDPFYGSRGVRCLDFVRSAPAPRDDCALGWREQLNQVSAYIDGSPIYASSARQSDKLRLFRNGMLQYGRVQQRRPILPPERRDELCRGGAVSTDCFKSGDARVNEQPGLVAAHIVWLRQHNRMAQELAHLNPQWSDEKIYQETRKIVGAMVQHITYREFLPIVLGPEVMRTFELELLAKGYYKHYNPKINPNPASSFGSAAFRFGHSLVQPSMMRFDRLHRPMNNNVSLHNELTNPSNIWSMNAVDRLLLGMVNQPIQKRDEFITEELTNHLFQTPQFDFGMDLAAINIQRGRDHGVPPYTVWRDPCGLSPIEDFEDLFKVMPSRVVWKLKVLYRSVDDIDLFTGGMAERPVVGGLVGPTFACIIAQQFLNMRKGDRFWYENGGFESSFTPAQLQQIRRISFAQVLCRTLDTITNIQPFAFLSSEHPDNDRISCQNGLLNNFDLSPWIEINSESNNDIRKSDEDPPTQKPKRTKPTTAKPTTAKPTTAKPTTAKSTTTTTKSTRTTTKITRTTTKRTNSVTKRTQIANKVNSKRPQIDNSTKAVNKTEHKLTLNKTDAISKEIDDFLNISLTNDEDLKVNMTVQIDDKLDFKNKTKRFDDIPNIDSRNSRPKKNYGDYDYEDDDTQSVQSVVISNGPHKRPYNYNRPILTVTENTNKYTYLINYVPRPTESYRQTTRRPHDRDVVKVTYQTYDDTYRRPNKPYYYNNRHELNENYRHNRPSTRTTISDNLHSSARSNDDTERTTVRPKPTEKTDFKLKLSDKTEVKTDASTTENMYKLVTFGYVGTYKGDTTDDKLTFKTDNSDKVDDKMDLKHDTISKDFSTYAKTDIVDENVSNKMKLSTFFLYDTATKSYNLQRSTRRNDDDEIDIGNNNKYYYVNNVLHRHRKPDTTTTDKPLIELTKDIIKENYNNPGVPEDNIEDRSSLDNMPNLDIESKSAAGDKLRIKVKKPASPAKTPSVAFQVIPSEISPSQWAIYDEDTTLPEGLPHKMPLIKTDPHALREFPRPITLIGLRRRRPGLF